MSRQRILLGVVFALVVCVVAYLVIGDANHRPVTRANWNRIADGRKDGMTVEQVEEFMGKGEPFYGDSTPEQVADLKRIEDTFKMLRWKRGEREIVVVFSKGKVGIVFTRGFPWLSYRINAIRFLLQ